MSIAEVGIGGCVHSTMQIKKYIYKEAFTVLYF